MGTMTITCQFSRSLEDNNKVANQGFGAMEFRVRFLSAQGACAADVFWQAWPREPFP